MQLILVPENPIEINKKMSEFDQESLDEKILTNGVAEEPNKNVVCGNKEITKAEENIIDNSGDTIVEEPANEVPIKEITKAEENIIANSGDTIMEEPANEVPIGHKENIIPKDNIIVNNDDGVIEKSEAVNPISNKKNISQSNFTNNDHCHSNSEELNNDISVCKELNMQTEENNSVEENNSNIITSNNKNLQIDDKIKVNNDEIVDEECNNDDRNEIKENIPIKVVKIMNTVNITVEESNNDVSFGNENITAKIFISDSNNDNVFNEEMTNDVLIECKETSKTSHNIIVNDNNDITIVAESNNVDSSISNKNNIQLLGNPLVNSNNDESFNKNVSISNEVDIQGPDNIVINNEATDNLDDKPDNEADGVDVEHQRIEIQKPVNNVATEESIVENIVTSGHLSEPQDGNNIKANEEPKESQKDIQGDCAENEELTSAKKQIDADNEIETGEPKISQYVAKAQQNKCPEKLDVQPKIIVQDQIFDSEQNKTNDTNLHTVQSSDTGKHSIVEEIHFGIDVMLEVTSLKKESEHETVKETESEKEDVEQFLRQTCAIKPEPIEEIFSTDKDDSTFMECDAAKSSTDTNKEITEDTMECDEFPDVTSNENSENNMDCDLVPEIANANVTVPNISENFNATEKETDSDNLTEVLYVKNKDIVPNKDAAQNKTNTDEIERSAASDCIEEFSNVDNVNYEANSKKVEPFQRIISSIEKINEEVAEGNKVASKLCRLSNTLDILSDDEDETPKEKNNSSLDDKISCFTEVGEISSSTEKQCVNIEDDDDIMLIDEDTIAKDSNAEVTTPENTIQNVNVTNPDNNEINLDKGTESQSSEEPATIHEKDAVIPETPITDRFKEPTINEKPNEDQPDMVERKPLVPDNFFKTYKRNLADMARDDLEEFCVLKIVESIIDRSNFNEIRAKLKTMTQSIEEHKLKTMMLTKQNRDLQVVLKSVQEEQKKSGKVGISPLKITRSVGMQVVMNDRISRRRGAVGPLSAMNTNNNYNTNNNRPIRNATNPGPRSQKQIINNNNNQQIPVPRLVPASNNAVTKTPNVISLGPSANNIGKTASPMPNGVKNSPPVQVKAEKRPLNRPQSVTVDLTDDEPPPKVNRIAPAPPVRLVSPQNLLAPRQQFTQSANTPRKVYIPISSPQAQNQIRPGQTFMVKSVPPSSPRPRAPSTPVVRVPQNSVRMSRVQSGRHPAALPDAMKQYQPPNWKALPPSPDLKLSKVENGIVISWKIDGYQEDSYEEIASYQLYAYQETSAPPNTALWKKIGDVKALPLPMACTLTQFMAGFKYYFAVRAVDVRSRFGPFSLPASILLLNKM